MRSLRLAKIMYVALKYGLDEFLLGHERFRWLRPTARTLTFWRTFSLSRGERLRLALQELGPIFVKFGQAVSTRRDLLSADIANELARLQDRVPPFPGAVAREIVERAHGRPVTETFSSFEEMPLADAPVLPLLGREGLDALERHEPVPVPDEDG